MPLHRLARNLIITLSTQLLQCPFIFNTHYFQEIKEILNRCIQLNMMSRSTDPSPVFTQALYRIVHTWSVGIMSPEFQCSLIISQGMGVYVCIIAFALGRNILIDPPFHSPFVDIGVVVKVIIRNPSAACLEGILAGKNFQVLSIPVAMMRLGKHFFQSQSPAQFAGKLRGKGCLEGGLSVSS